MVKAEPLVMEQLSYNRYLPIVLLYFFFNGVFLPLGLLYTTILAPFFIVWLYKHHAAREILYFFPFMLPFAIVHSINGVNEYFYVRSFFLLLATYIFVLAFRQFLKLCHSLRTLYKNILLINAVLVVVALIALLIPYLTSTFWYANEITSGVAGIKRLQMLTYEPSYYSTLLAPIALYYYLKIILKKLPNVYAFLLLVTIPLLLSLSFGVILGIALSMLFTILSGFKTFFPGKNLALYLIISGIVVLVSLIVFIQVFPDNVFVIRLNNVLSGRDTSFRGRTTDSFFLGWAIAEKKNLLFGAGLGQVKEIGLPFFNDFYNYEFKIEEIAIPNSLGDTLATFGLIGVIIRLGAEVFLFFRTRVYSNYYRLNLFLFIFIYQFTGSFLTNIAEYVIWILAFHRGLFPEFNRDSLRTKTILKPFKDPQ